MAKFSLSSHIIRVHDKYTGDHYTLNSIIGQDSKSVYDFYDILTDYLKYRMEKISRDTKDQNMYRVSKLDISDDNKKSRIIIGQFEYGNFGYGSKLIDVDQYKLSYNRKTKDAELLPYFFLMWIPRNSDKGIIILERIRQLGVKSTFSDDFNSYLKSGYPNTEIELDDIIPEKVLNEYLNSGRILKMRYLKNGLPKDIVDRLENPEKIQKDGYWEVAIYAKKNKFVLNNLKEHIFNKTSSKPNQLFQFMGNEFETLKIEVELGKNKRTFNIEHLNSARPYIDISHDVKQGADGHPNYIAMNTFALQLLKDIKDQIGIKDE